MEHLESYLQRIDRLSLAHKPTFGKMNVRQMVCHCTDFYRMALGTKLPEEYDRFTTDALKALAKAGKTVPAPAGFGQVEGKGTAPTDFENDKELLKRSIIDFYDLPPDYVFARHAYFGFLSREKWLALAAYHLNHHLEQFGV